MTEDILEFETMGGAIIRFDLKKCDECETKACIEADHLPFLGPVLELEEGRPSLMWSSDEIKKGKCTDCVACELACQSHGNNGVTITYPIPKLDEYISGLEKKGIKPVYKR
jgi:ferredoxin